METRTREELRDAIERVFCEWKQFAGNLANLVIVPVMDDESNRLLLQSLTKPHGIQYSQTLVHLELRDGKIWVEADATERGIAEDLMKAGVPQACIVLGFYPPALRREGDFAQE